MYTEDSRAQKSSNNWLDNRIGGNDSKKGK